VVCRSRQTPTPVVPGITNVSKLLSPMIVYISLICNRRGLQTQDVISLVVGQCRSHKNHCKIIMEHHTDIPGINDLTICQPNPPATHLPSSVFLMFYHSHSITSARSRQMLLSLIHPNQHRFHYSHQGLSCHTTLLRKERSYIL